MKTLRYLALLGLVTLIGGSLVSCEDENTDKYTNECTSISYLLTMSPDLLKFVSPEVTYVDAQGNVHKISGVKELDSLINIGFTYTPGIGVWTIQTIKGTNYKCWNLNMNFKNRPFHSYMGVKYKRNDFVEDTTGVVYDFHHSIYTTTVYVNSEFSITTTYNYWTKNSKVNFEFGTGAVVENHLQFTKNSYYKGGEVEEYINNLVNTPDKVGFYIDDKGKFTENIDFPL